MTAVVAERRQRGVGFEQADLPGLCTAGGIAEVAGNYPSAGGGGERAVAKLIDEWLYGTITRGFGPTQAEDDCAA